MRSTTEFHRNFTLVVFAINIYISYTFCTMLLVKIKLVLAARQSLPREISLVSFYEITLERHKLKSAHCALSRIRLRKIASRFSKYWINTKCILRVQLNFSNILIWREKKIIKYQALRDARQNRERNRRDNDSYIFYNAWIITIIL